MPLELHAQVCQVHIYHAYFHSKCMQIQFYKLGNKSNLEKFSNVPSMVNRQNKYIAAKSTQLLSQRDIVSMCLLKSNFQMQGRI